MTSTARTHATGTLPCFRLSFPLCSESLVHGKRCRWYFIHSAHAIFHFEKKKLKLWPENPLTSCWAGEILAAMHRARFLGPCATRVYSCFLYKVLSFWTFFRLNAQRMNENCFCLSVATKIKANLSTRAGQTVRFAAPTVPSTSSQCSSLPSRIWISPPLTTAPALAAPVLPRSMPVLVGLSFPLVGITPAWLEPAKPASLLASLLSCQPALPKPARSLVAEAVLA